MHQGFFFLNMSAVSTKLYGENFPNLVSEVCLSKFKALGKTGKPKDDGEYTLLACFVKRCNQEKLEVVALGTGSKCIGASRLPSNGDILHDSHAEVIARRAFMLYLISEIDQAISGEASIVERKQSGKFNVIPGVTFHFYISQTPCGDASIFPKQSWTVECCGEEIGAVKSEEKHVTTYANDGAKKELISVNSKNIVIKDIDEPPFKKLKHMQNNHFEVNLLEQSQSWVIDGKAVSDSVQNGKVKPLHNSNDDVDRKCDLGQNDKSCGHENLTQLQDIHRTGAKCVLGEKEDPKASGTNYHITGVLRTKPGRGDPTLSMSCSDKIFKWTVLGIQGALLMQFLENPIYIESITIGQCPYSQGAIERALFNRFKDKLSNVQLPCGFQVATPSLFQSSIEFPFSRSVVTNNCLDVDKVKPSPGSIIWSLTSFHQCKHEVSVNGYKLGTTKKAVGTPKSWVSICRQALLQQILLLKQKSTSRAEEDDDKTYAQIKQLAESYQEAWGALRELVLYNWTSKPRHTKDFKPEIKSKVQ